MSSEAAEVVARAREAPHLWRFANAEFDERSFELRVEGTAVEIERAPLRVLRELLQCPGEVVSRETLLATVWKRRPETISRNALTNAIGKLRRALGDEAQRLVEAHAGEGYRLTAAVERRVLPQLQSLDQLLKAGQPTPLRPNWLLRTRIDTTDSSAVWKVEHAKTREIRVFKFAADGFQLAALRREVTISRLLNEALGPRPEFVRIHDWNLEQPPYFTEAEYAGADLAHWADAAGGLQQVTLAERLAVIAELADALALAHSVGALHKDLKPGNVAIQVENGQRRVRILDFGSGRLLDPEILDQYQITRLSLPEADANTGTPFYLAPELLAGHAPTIASDLYSLGVLLYQFVVGDLQKPISPGWEAEIDDPLLREDIATAAAGNPARRPASASEIAQRLRRLDERRRQREQERIEAARTAELRERLKTAEQRRRGLRWAVAALALGLAATSMLYFKLLSSEHQLATALQHADDEASDSKAVTRYVLSLFDTANPEKSGGKPIAPRALVDFGRDQLEKQSQGHPAVRARMTAALADLYCKLGEAEACRQEIEAALAVQRAIGAGADPEVTALFLQIASHADELQIRDDDAEKNLREALALIDSRADTDRGLLAQVLQELGTVLQRRGRNAEAIGLLERARELQRGPDGADTLEGAKTLMALSKIELDQGQGDAALTLATQVVALTASKAGTDDLRYFDALANQANILIGETRYTESEKLMRQALAGFQQIYGAKGRRVFEMQSAMVDLLNRQGRLREASQLATEVVEGMRPKAGPDDPAFAVALNDAGVMRQRYGDYEGALEWLRQAYAIDHRHFGDGEPQTIAISNNLGVTLILAGRADEALTLLRQPMSSATNGSEIGYSRGRRLVLTGQALSALGRHDEAASAFDAAEAQLAKIPYSGFNAPALVHSARGSSLALEGRYAEALPLLEQALAEYLQLSVANHTRILEVRSFIALCEAHLGRGADARQTIAEVQPLIEKELAPTHCARAILRQAIAALLSVDRDPA